MTVDLGDHYVGYFSFTMGWVDMFIDAPVRLKVNFYETEAELDYSAPPRDDSISLSWIQEEIINIDYPGEYKMPRRYAARYIKIEVLASPKKLTLSGFKFTAVTSADESALDALDNEDKELVKIDEVASKTLKNCMHRVFEDGPKRDRRLWTGDLRLQALVNYHTFKNNALVRRCLYLFAAARRNGAGFLPGFLYEYPEYESGYWFLQDYALLFAAALCDYYRHTRDAFFFEELYPVAKSQLDAMHENLDEDGITKFAEGSDIFIDWCPGLSKITSMHGVYLYVLDAVADTLSLLGHGDEKIYRQRYKKGVEDAKAILFDSKMARFVNKKDSFQFSVHSCVWMILSGVVSGDEGKRMLLDSLESKESLKAVTPYMNHYLVEAMIKLGMKELAIKHIKDYWGGMIALGADTFYEVHIHDDPYFSPYKGNYPLNSMCHAWSCTPAYFIRSGMLE